MRWRMTIWRQVLTLVILPLVLAGWVLGMLGWMLGVGWMGWVGGCCGAGAIWLGGRIITWTRPKAGIIWPEYLRETRHIRHLAALSDAQLVACVTQVLRDQGFQTVPCGAREAKVYRDGRWFATARVMREPITDQAVNQFWFALLAQRRLAHDEAPESAPLWGWLFSLGESSVPARLVATRYHQMRLIGGADLLQMIWVYRGASRGWDTLHTTTQRVRAWAWARLPLTA